MELNILKDTDLNLSTITIDAKISNIQFKEYELIHELELNENIIKIASNGKERGDPAIEKISDLYTILTTKVKSNRGRKPKPKPKKRVPYFRSQISFSLLKNEKIYYVKLFVNGSMQIPAIKNEDLSDGKELLDDFIKYISNYDNVKEDKEKNIELLYLVSIMRNYITQLKFSIPNKNIVYKLDLISLYKILSDEKLDVKKYFTFELFNSNFSIENYTGLTIKFLTPIEDFKKNIFSKYKKNKNIKKNNKQTTAKIFSSCKINIDGCNNKDEALIIYDDLIKFFNIFKEKILYSIPV
jgi:hypothetical protein